MSTRSTGRPAQSAAAPAERPRSRNICTFVLGVERCCWLDDLAVCTSSAMHHGGLGAVAAYQYSQERIRTTSCAQIGPRIFGGTRYPQDSRSGATAPHGHKPEGASISHGQSLTRCLARSSVRKPLISDNGPVASGFYEHSRLAVTIPCAPWSGFYETTWAPHGQSAAPAVSARSSPQVI